MEVEGKPGSRGPWADQCTGVERVRCDIVMRTPDGHGRLELAKYLDSGVLAAGPQNPPYNTVHPSMILLIRGRAGLDYARVKRLPVPPPWRLGMRGVIEVHQKMSRWDVENPSAAPSPE